MRELGAMSIGAWNARQRTDSDRRFKWFSSLPEDTTSPGDILGSPGQSPYELLVLSATSSHAPCQRFSL